MSEYIKVRECGNYGLKSNSELWAQIKSEHAFRAGYVWDMDCEGAMMNAIDTFEEEMRCEIAEWI